MSIAGAGADWTASDVGHGTDGGSTFTLHGPDGAAGRPACGCPGRFNVANAVLAVALLDAVQVPVETALAGIADTVVPGRMEPVDAGQPFVAVVDYAHTPDAVTTALGALRAATAGRLITVLGCGGDRDPGKRADMGAAAALGSDVLVVTDDNPRSEDPAAIRAAMLAGVRRGPGGRRAEVVEIGNRRAALPTAVGWRRPGTRCWSPARATRPARRSPDPCSPFDDRDVLRDVLRELAPAEPALGENL